MPSWLRLIDVVMFVCFSEEIYSFEHFVIAGYVQRAEMTEDF